MKHMFISAITAACLLLAGCSYSLNEDPGLGIDPDTGSVSVGNSFLAGCPDSRLTLIDNKDALAAEGLYYATWVMGDCEEYTNSEGETVDLYDAQLYLLVGETRDETSAGKNRDTWLAAAEANYDVQDKKELISGGQNYTLLIYNCRGEDNPYERGVSAFGTSGTTAVCAEFTCRPGCTEDLETILKNFLDNSTYK